LPILTQNNSQHQFLAMDFGAESGRGELITLSENKIQIKERGYAESPSELS